jgi:ligand-binding sensor domain-containing protein/signal transduction histidine kinase/DNA-binding response OmpR family regulator
MYRSFLVLIKVIMLSAGPLFSQTMQSEDVEVQFKHLSINDGLSSSSVICIMQDKEGFIWFGTRDGLNKYDGYSFTVYHYSSSDSASLSNNWVKTIFEDSHGSLWVGTQNGLNRFDRCTENFTRYYHDDNNVNSLSHNVISSIAEDDDGYLWVGTQKGLNRYDKKRNQFVRYLHTPGDSGSIIDNRIKNIIQDSKSRLWVNTYKGLDLLNRQDFSFSHFFVEKEEPLNPNEITALTEDTNGNIWRGNSHGLKVLYTGSNRFVSFSISGKSKIRSIDSPIRSILEDTEGILWVGTYNGLYRIDRNKNSISLLQNIEGKQRSLSQNSVYSIVEDTKGDLWIGTWAGGVNYLDRNYDVFRHHTHSTSPNSLSYKVVSSLVEDEKGNLWVGTEGGGLNYFNRKSNTFHHYRHRKDNSRSISADNIKSVISDHHGDLWIGTHDGGLNFFDPDAPSKGFINYRHNASDPKSLDNDRVISLHEDSDHKIWIGTSGGGLNLLNKKEQSFVKINKKFNAIGDQVFVINEDDDKNLLIGSNNGLCRINLTDFSLNHFAEGLEILLEGKTILSILQLNQTNLYLGTEGEGLYHYNLENGALKNYTKKEGLPNDVIYGIIPDGDFNLWLSTNKGLSKFNTENQTFRYYDLQSGLQSNEFNYGSYLKTSRGELLFGGSNGITLFYPDEVKDNQFVPPVVVTAFYIKNKLIEVGDANSPLQASIEKTSEIYLDYDQSTFGFNFVALSYSQSGKNQYAYKLEGFDEDWNYIDNKRTATYTNINPGNYIFKVKASNNNLLWNEKGASIKMSIAPPPWKTWWAYLIYFIIFSLIVLSIRKYALIRIRDKNALKQERLDKEKLEEVNRMKIRFFNNISHDFRTPLTLILGPLERLINSHQKDGKVKQQYLIMQRNARMLLRLINQLLDLSKHDSGKLKLKAVNSNVVDFVKEVTIAFQEHARFRHIDFTFHSSAKKIPLWFDPDKLEEILFNLLSNAFKHTPDYGKISVRLQTTDLFSEGINSRAPIGHGSRDNGSGIKSNKFVEIEVTDNGEGMSSQFMVNIFERFYQIERTETDKYSGTGIGLALTKDLVTLHQGDISVRSEEQNGTSFIVKLPLGNVHLKEEEMIRNFRDSEDVAHYNLQKLHAAKLTLQRGKSKKRAVTSGGSNENLILVVEDNTAVRDYICENFENEYQVIEAGNGEEGLQLATKMMPDLIISDVMMPKMDGIEFCRRLKTDLKTSHIPVILLTARTSLVYQKNGLETGADDYVTKPFNTTLLTLRVNNLITSRQKLKERFVKQVNLQPGEVTITSTDHQFLQKAIKIVEDHMSDSKFKVDDFIKEINMSRSVLFRKLKALTGQSTNEFIKTIRLKRAAQLFERSDLNISEIAYEVGFNDPKYFRNCFKKQFGKSPSRYREKWLATRDIGLEKSSLKTMALLNGILK